jgi:sulfur carrier protein ThiS
LILRDKEFQVKPGMTLRDALTKIEVSPEAVLATREGEMITDDVILRDGEVIRLIAVISGG